jgi:hypothetical protein
MAHDAVAPGRGSWATGRRGSRPGASGWRAPLAWPGNNDTALRGAVRGTVWGGGDEGIEGMLLFGQ